MVYTRYTTNGVLDSNPWDLRIHKGIYFPIRGNYIYQHKKGGGNRTLSIEALLFDKCV